MPGVVNSEVVVCACAYLFLKKYVSVNILKYSAQLISNYS
jgi:hypothetical protein